MSRAIAFPHVLVCKSKLPYLEFGRKGKKNSLTRKEKKSHSCLYKFQSDKILQFIVNSINNLKL